MPRAQRSDVTIALVLAVAGMLATGMAFATRRDALSIAPALDAELAMTHLGFVLALLHGLPYRRALYILAPAVLLMTVAAARQGESIPALLGVTAIVYGLLGLARAHVAEPQPRARSVRSQ
jgi:hypothetical protein